MRSRETISAGHGKAAVLKKGQAIKIINTSGAQVVDTWAFNQHDLKEYMSMEHTRAELLTLMPSVGDSFLTNTRRPILSIEEDTCGVHDILISSCDKYRYKILGCKGYHRSCTDNLYEGLEQLDLQPPQKEEQGKLKYVAPASKPNDFILLRAELDAVVVFSACPNDMLQVNGTIGADGSFKVSIQDCHFEIL